MAKLPIAPLSMIPSKKTFQSALLFLALAVSSTVALAVSSTAFAEEAPVAVPAGGQASAPASMPQAGLLQTMTPFLLMFGVMYFLVMRPQQKKMKEQQAMIAALSIGDQILTTSGIFGKVQGIAEKVITLEIDQDVRVKLLKSQISQVIKDPSKDLASQLA